MSRFETRMFTVRQFAELTSFTPQTIYKRIKRGEIRVLRVGGGRGGRIRIPEAEAVRYLQTSHPENGVFAESEIVNCVRGDTWINVWDQEENSEQDLAPIADLVHEQINLSQEVKQ